MSVNKTSPNPPTAGKIKSGIELERKFLINARPSGLEKHTHYNVVQAYLKITPDEEVRVRKASGAVYAPAAKSDGREEGCSITTKRGKGLSRKEDIEIIDDGQFERLMQKIEGRVIEKTRYEIPYQGHLIELDIYGGELTGLMVAEIEFASEEESKRFIPPKWLGPEVTEDERYKNKNISKDGKPS